MFRPDLRSRFFSPPPSLSPPCMCSFPPNVCELAYGCILFVVWVNIEGLTNLVGEFSKNTSLFPECKRRGEIFRRKWTEKERVVSCEKEWERKWMGHNIPFLREVSSLNYSNFTTADSAHISLQSLCESRVLLFGIAGYKTSTV